MTRDLLVVDRVVKRFGGLKAVGGDDGLSFAVPEGTFLGLIGPNGAGKSTTFNLISGVLKPDSGAVMLDGVDLAQARASRIAALGLGRTFQTPRAFPSLSVLDNVIVGADNEGERVGMAFSGRWRIRERALREKAAAVLARVGLSDRIGDRVGVVPDTLRGWVKQARIDAGETAGTTTSDAARIKALEAENRELKRANEILLAASSFFARELDPRLPW